MKAEAIADWVERYRRAWESNDPGEIGDLFTEEAVYSPGPFEAPWAGRAQIVRAWLGRQDAPGSTTFRYEVIAAAQGVAVVRCWTTYLDGPREYSNIWVIRFGEGGRCREFGEWWVEKR
jgi:uncharacterized protein (TIGR02246 family)